MSKELYGKRFVDEKGNEYTMTKEGLVKDGEKSPTYKYRTSIQKIQCREVELVSEREKRSAMTAAKILLKQLLMG